MLNVAVKGKPQRLYRMSWDQLFRYTVIIVDLKTNNRATSLSVFDALMAV